MPNGSYSSVKNRLNDACNVIKTLPGMSDFDCSLSGERGEGFVKISLIRMIEKSNLVFWVIVTEDDKVAYQVKSVKWLSTYYELFEDTDRFYVVWNDNNRITQYYLVELTN